MDALDGGNRDAREQRGPRVRVNFLLGFGDGDELSPQPEGPIRPSAEPVSIHNCREGLSEQETQDVLDYFDSYKDGRSPGSITAVAPVLSERRLP